MGLTKRTYALPPETIDEFERVVESGKRSTVINELIRSWLNEQHRARLRSAIVEGCREMTEVYRETEQEYHPLEEEVEHGTGS